MAALSITDSLPFYDYYQWLFQGHVVSVLLFGMAPDWRRPARTPRTGVPEADLSVQLSAWMLLEAAARTASAAAPPSPAGPA